jgi:hypothetical protein
VSTVRRNPYNGRDHPPVMSTVSLAEDRALTALIRIERALAARAPAGPEAGPQGEAERAALARDCELLREECEALRRELAGLRARQDRLVAVVDEVEGRLEGAIGQLDQLAEE